MNSFLVAAGAAVVPVATLVALAVQSRRMRKAERQARAREAELRASYERIRDIGARLLAAQESERARIARELHDDIGQQLALLQLHLQLGDVAAGRAALETLTASVRALSQRLHPARLSQLGLVAAVHQLQQEFGSAPMAIAFKHSNIPRELPLALSLCLFRVIQEALRNALKHSGAGEITIDLERHDNALSLEIADDGRGFEAQAGAETGLGLISMRERVEAVGGVLAIRSQSGAGTTIEVRVPAGIENTESVSSGISMTSGGAASRSSFDTHDHRPAVPSRNHSVTAI